MSNQYTKEKIKSRMYKQAAALWGVRNMDGVDSVVRLLIEALSSELFKLSGEMYTIENRLLEKVASALTPHTSLIGKPSHSIATAHPYSTTAVIRPSDKLNYRSSKAGSKKQHLKSCVFTPLCESVITNVGLKYLVAVDEFCEIAPDRERDTVAKITSKQTEMNGKVWLGVKFGSNVSKVNELPLYIDFPFVSDKNIYLQLLSHCKCSLAGNSVGVRGGIPRKNSDTLAKHYDIDTIITEELLCKYDSHFITLDCSDLNIKTLHRSKVPHEIEHLLPADFIESRDADTVWIAIEFPAFFSSEILTQIKVYLNAFVIANKYPAKVSRVVDSVSTIIPLAKEETEYLLTTTSVSDGKWNQLSEIPFSSQASAYGTYSIRRGGCERFNTTDARNLLSRLTDLLYDESVAFVSDDRDGLRGQVDQIQKQISILEQLNNDSAENVAKEPLSYIVVEIPNEDNSLITAEYLLTNGEFANGISAGEVLECNTNADIEENSLMLLSTSRDGMAPPSAKVRMDMYRFLLLSHGRIYSKQDIKNFCLAKYGEFISSVDVKLGYAPGIEKTHGFIRTLDILITPKLNSNKQYLDELTTDLYNEIRLISPETYNYRIKIDNILK